MPEVTFINQSWTLDASVSDVFDVLTNVERWPEWSNQIRSASRSGSGSISPGETLQFTPDLALPIPLRSTIRDVREPEKLSWGVAVPGFTIEHSFELQSNGSTCKLHQTETATGLLAPVGLPLKGTLRAFDQSLGDDLQEYFRSRNS
jgi:hypothetical protein